MRLVTALLLLILLRGLFLAFVSLVCLVLHSQDLLLSLAAGILVGVLLDQFVIRKIPGAETFEHELTHAVAALLFFRRVSRFVVTRYEGGYLQHGGGFGGEFANDFIGLAPYVLPTFTSISVLARPFVPGGWFPWFDVWVGLTFGYHVWSTIREMRDNWSRRSFSSAETGEPCFTDIARRGFVYSLVFIVSITLAIHGVLLSVLVKGYAGIPVWWHMVWRDTLPVISLIVGSARDLTHWIWSLLGQRRHT
jgi:hypothetical protein